MKASEVFLFFVPLVKLSISLNYLDDVTLTSKQMDAFDQFKDKVMKKLPHDYMQKDIYLVRWLRATSFNVPAAEQMLLNHLEWRKTNRMDTIHEEDWSDIERDSKFWVEGQDKKGRPLLYIPSGAFPVRRYVLSGKGERIQRYIDYALEMADRRVREYGEKYQNVTRGILILNSQGFNVFQHTCLPCIPVSLHLVAVYQSQYPEIADKIIAINVPNAAASLINVIMGGLDDTVRSVVKIFGTNRKKWEEYLYEQFDKDQLPIEIGGTRDLPE